MLLIIAFTLCFLGREVDVRVVLVAASLAVASPALKPLAVLEILLGRRDVSKTAKYFFEGMGYAYAQVISLVITANCFTAAIKQVDLPDKLVRIVSREGIGGKLATVFSRLAWCDLRLGHRAERGLFESRAAAFARHEFTGGGGLRRAECDRGELRPHDVAGRDGSDFFRRAGRRARAGCRHAHGGSG